MWGPFITGFSNQNINNFAFENKMLNYNTFPGEKLLTKYLKFTLGVHSKTSNTAVFMELAQYPLYIQLIKLVFKYWLSPDTINKPLLSEALKEDKLIDEKGNKSWFSFIKEILKELNMEQFLNNSNNVNDNLATSLIHDIVSQLKTRFRRKLSSDLNQNDKKLRTYKVFKYIFKTEPYLNCVTNLKHRNSLSRFRTSAHKLEIEVGRYKNIVKEERYCKYCSNNCHIEDEIHFLLKCPIYNSLRSPFITSLKSKFVNLDSLSDENVFTWLLSSEDKFTSCLLAKFIHEAFTLRESHIYSS